MLLMWSSAVYAIPKLLQPVYSLYTFYCLLLHYRKGLRYVTDDECDFLFIGVKATIQNLAAMRDKITLLKIRYPRLFISRWMRSSCGDTRRIIFYSLTSEFVSVNVYFEYFKSNAYAFFKNIFITFSVMKQNTKL